MSTACLLELNALDGDNDALESDLIAWWLWIAADTPEEGDLDACVVIGGVIEPSVTRCDM